MERPSWVSHALPTPDLYLMVLLPNLVAAVWFLPAPLPPFIPASLLPPLQKQPPSSQFVRFSLAPLPPYTSACRCLPGTEQLYPHYACHQFMPYTLWVFAATHHLASGFVLTCCVCVNPADWFAAAPPTCRAHSLPLNGSNTYLRTATTALVVPLVMPGGRNAPSASAVAGCRFKVFSAVMPYRVGTFVVLRPYLPLGFLVSSCAYLPPQLNNSPGTYPPRWMITGFCHGFCAWRFPTPVPGPGFLPPHCRETCCV